MSPLTGLQVQVQNSIAVQSTHSLADIMADFDGDFNVIFVEIGIRILQRFLDKVCGRHFILFHQNRQFWDLAVSHQLYNVGRLSQ